MGGDNAISFFDKDLVRVQTPYDDDVFIYMMIANYDIKKVLVDNKSSTYILFYDALAWMNLSDTRLKRASTSLVNFSKNSIEIKGEITLPITIRTPP